VRGKREEGKRQEGKRATACRQSGNSRKKAPVYAESTRKQSYGESYMEEIETVCKGNKGSRKRIRGVLGHVLRPSGRHRAGRECRCVKNPEITSVHAPPDTPVHQIGKRYSTEQA